MRVAAISPEEVFLHRMNMQLRDLGGILITVLFLYTPPYLNDVLFQTTPFSRPCLITGRALYTTPHSIPRPIPYHALFNTTPYSRPRPQMNISVFSLALPNPNLSPNPDHNPNPEVFFGSDAC